MFTLLIFSPSHSVKSQGMKCFCHCQQIDNWVCFDFLGCPISTPMLGVDNSWHATEHLNRLRLSERGAISWNNSSRFLGLIYACPAIKQPCQKMGHVCFALRWRRRKKKYLWTIQLLLCMHHLEGGSLELCHPQNEWRKSRKSHNKHWGRLRFLVSINVISSVEQLPLPFYTWLYQDMLFFCVFWNFGGQERKGRNWGEVIWFEVTGFELR